MYVTCTYLHARYSRCAKTWPSLNGSCETKNKWCSSCILTTKLVTQTNYYDNVMLTLNVGLVCFLFSPSMSLSLFVFFFFRVYHELRHDLKTDSLYRFILKKPRNITNSVKPVYNNQSRDPKIVAVRGLQAVVVQRLLCSLYVEKGTPL